MTWEDFRDVFKEFGSIHGDIESEHGYEINPDTFDKQNYPDLKNLEFLFEIILLKLPILDDYQSIFEFISFCAMDKNLNQFLFTFKKILNFILQLNIKLDIDYGYILAFDNSDVVNFLYLFTLSNEGFKFMKDFAMVALKHICDSNDQREVLQIIIKDIKSNFHQEALELLRFFDIAFDYKTEKDEMLLFALFNAQQGLSMNNPVLAEIRMLVTHIKSKFDIKK